MIECYITDADSLRGETLLESLARNMAAGVTWIQIREKRLSARELYELLIAMRALPNPHGTKLIVNTRADVALAAGADGVHFPSLSPEPRRWRAIVPQGFLLGVSCHSVEEVRAAEREGAAYALFGPVFAPLSKQSPLKPRGLSELRRAAQAAAIPVLALGGVTRELAPECCDAGAAGIAGISLYQSALRSC